MQSWWKNRTRQCQEYFDKVLQSFIFKGFILLEKVCWIGRLDLFCCQRYCSDLSNVKSLEIIVTAHGHFVNYCWPCWLSGVLGRKNSPSSEKLSLIEKLWAKFSKAPHYCTKLQLGNSWVKVVNKSQSSLSIRAIER